MLNNRFAGNIMKYIDKLFKAKIPMNAQIVLCKGINDGMELEKTISDLMEYAPVIDSLSVVPIGLTKYREGLCKIEPFNKNDAIKLIETVNHFQEIALAKYGYHFVHASDEWYINAGLPIPDSDNYDGFVQLENGVGMTRLLYDEVDEAIDIYLEAHNGQLYLEKKTVSVITGKLSYDIICEVCDRINKVAPNIKFNVYPITNNFFGESITVTGLLTGGDIVAQIKDKDLGDGLLLPCNTLKADEDIFLDDMTFAEFQNALQVPVIIVQSDGMSFFNSIIEMEKYNE